jgi:hypothetical protein
MARMAAQWRVGCGDRGGRCDYGGDAMTKSMVVGAKLDIIYRNEWYMRAELPNDTGILACVTIEGIEYHLHLVEQVYSNHITTC